MNFVQAIQAGFSNYANFSDRACRSEFWFWALFVVIAIIVLALIDNLVIGQPVFEGIFWLGTIVPNIAIQVRRLHDLDKSGWFWFFNFIPIVGPIILLVWFCSKGTSGPNKFGPDRLAS